MYYCLGFFVLLFFFVDWGWGEGRGGGGDENHFCFVLRNYCFLE
jgi:hypothetical protein